MSQGRVSHQSILFHSANEYCDRVLAADSVYRLLRVHGDALFPDEFFEDLYKRGGRNSIPPRILATVMVLQRMEGLSDREALERFSFDSRWRYACGALESDYRAFVHTVLVYMRARLRGSDKPTRVFDAVVGIAKEAGLVGTRRVLDSTPLYDAVATQDTVTLIRSSIRGVLKQCNPGLAQRLRGVLKRDDAYDSPKKPVCDWDDAEARERLIDELARDGQALLDELKSESLGALLQEAVNLLQTVLGQDLEIIEPPDSPAPDPKNPPASPREAGESSASSSEPVPTTGSARDASPSATPTPQARRYRVARRVAKNRIISTVDPETRHGHKTSARGFDGYKGHVSVDPDSELITAIAITPGNAVDAEVAEELLADVVDASSTEERREAVCAEPPIEWPSPSSTDVAAAGGAEAAGSPVPRRQGSALWQRILCTWKRLGWYWNGWRKQAGAWMGMGTSPSECPPAWVGKRGEATPAPRSAAAYEVFGDSSYGVSKVLIHLEGAGVKLYTKVQVPAARKGCFSQSDFKVDLTAETAECPAGHRVELERCKDGSRRAAYGERCAACPLRERCTRAKAGRTLRIHSEYELLSRHRKQQRAPGWKEHYRATRPKVERKIAHLMRRKHGGRRVRMRGTLRVRHDFSWLAAATNLHRLAKLGLTRRDGHWKTAQ